MRLLIAAAFCLTINTANAQSVDPADFTTNGFYAGSNTYTNYNPTGTLSTGLSLSHISFTFLVPVSNLSFAYNQYGHSFAINFNGTDLPVGVTMPQHPSAWFDVSVPSSLPALYTLQFHYPYMNSGFGIKLMGYARAEALAAPSPLAGAGLPALLAFVLLWCFRSHAARRCAVAG